jgi:hypothetical protein
MANSSVWPGADAAQETAAQWFGPLAPPLPTAPSAVAGRRFDFQSGINLVQRPRAYEPISFDQLRSLADSYDVLRIIIETRKDQMKALPWAITPKDPKAKMEGDLKKRADALKAFLRKPDRQNSWTTWLGMVLEDLLVLDAPAVYKRPTRGGGLYALEPIDGGTIKKVVDEWGRTPMAPDPAYQQQLKGLPAVNYTVDELLYRPRNVRTHKLYGYSPVEQIIMTINIALKREVFQLEYFTAGNVPDSLIGVPETWTNTMIKEFQTWWDQTLQGNSAARRTARFVPGGVAKGYTPTKTEEIFGKAEEWLARVVCFAFSCSPQPFVQQQNRATAETAKSAATEEGLVPLKAWVKELIDDVIEGDLGVDDLEFSWLEEEEIDAKTKAEIAREDAKAGIISIDEARDGKGLDPLNADGRSSKLMVWTSRGYVPVELEDQMDEARQKAELAAEFMPDPAAPGEDDDDPDGGGKPPAGKGQPKGKPSGDKPPVGGRAGGKDEGKTRAKAALPSSGTPVPINPEDFDPFAESKAMRRARRRIEKALIPVLADMGDDVAADVEAAIKRAIKVTKADEDESAPPPAAGATLLSLEGAVDLDSILADLDLSGFESVRVMIEDELRDLVLDEGKRVIAAISAGTDIDAADLFEVVNTRAVSYARERSAELVSQVTETTRKLIRETVEAGLRDNIGTPAIADRLQENFGFSAKRAQLIADTEVRFANSRGALAGYRAAKAAGVPLKKRWLVGANSCESCVDNGAVGLIDLDDNFPDGSDAPPGHPNCVCAISAEIDESDAQ